MKFFYSVFIHFIVARDAPKYYKKYICYCVKHKKMIDTNMLIKLMRIAHITKQLK